MVRYNRHCALTDGVLQSLWLIELSIPRPLVMSALDIQSHLHLPILELKWLCRPFNVRMQETWAPALNDEHAISSPTRKLLSLLIFKTGAPAINPFIWSGWRQSAWLCLRVRSSFYAEVPEETVESAMARSANNFTKTSDCSRLVAWAIRHALAERFGIPQ